MSLVTEQGQILIIHANAARRDPLGAHLREVGYSVLLASDGAEALRQVRSAEPDLIVLDAGLNGAGTVQLVGDLQADKSTKIIPVILLAPQGSAALIQECLDAGAEDYLYEPYSRASLRELIRDYLAISARRRQELRRAERENLLKIDHDVQIAHGIQQDFLPRALPQPAGWETAACFYPARLVAGDFYDCFELSQGRRIALVIADVCDKGVPAALYMALFRTLFRAYAQQNYAMRVADLLDDRIAPVAGARQRGVPRTGTGPLKNAMDLTNRYMAQTHADANMFATTFFGVLDPASGQLTYVNGGHNPPVVVGAGGIKARLKPTGPAVGMFPDIDYKIGEVTLEPGDILFTYTDGVTDAKDPAGTLFSEKRMLALVEEPAGSAHELLDRLDTALHTHISTASQFDDITMLAVHRSL